MKVTHVKKEKLLRSFVPSKFSFFFQVCFYSFFFEFFFFLSMSLVYSLAMKIDDHRGL